MTHSKQKHFHITDGFDIIKVSPEAFFHSLASWIAEGNDDTARDEMRDNNIQYGIYCRTDKYMDYIAEILAGRKTIETRSRATLNSIASRSRGAKVALIEPARNGKPAMIRGFCHIWYGGHATSREVFEVYRNEHCIPAGSKYDWKPDTKQKVFYDIDEATPCTPFPVPSGAIRHGRSYIEF